MKGRKFLRKLHDKCLIFVLIFTLLVFRPDKSYAVPKFLNYQGKLSDATGAPVANGTYSITFSIYDAPTGGTPLWTESLSVPVNNGVFAVELGKVTTMPATLVSAPSLFLGVKVGSDPEMTPRSPLHPVPKAFLSEKAEDADKLGGKLPGEFVLKIDPKWNVLSNDDGTVNNADTQHTHSLGSAAGTVMLNPSATQVIQPSGDFPALSIKLSPGQTKPLLTLQNDAGTILGGLASQGLFGMGGLQLNAEGPATTTVSILNADATNVANLDVEGTVTAQKLSLLSDPRWNLLTNQDGVVDNADAMHTHSGGGGGVTQIVAGTNVTISPAAGTGIVTINATGGGGGGSVLLAPGSNQIIQPTSDFTPLILKAFAAAPASNYFDVQNSVGVSLLKVSQSGNVLIGSPSDLAPKLSVEFGSAVPIIALKQNGSGTALDVWNAGTGKAGVFSITNPANTTALISGDHSGTGNLLELSVGGISKFVVNNSGSITIGSAPPDPNAVKKNPSAIQTIQPTVDAVPLALKPGVGAPVQGLLLISNFADAKLLEVSPTGSLFIGAPSVTTAKVSVLETGTGNHTIYSVLDNASNPNSAVYGQTTGTGNAGKFEVINVLNLNSAVYASHNGSGTLFFGNTNGTGNLLLLQTSSLDKLIVENTGNITFGLGNKVIKAQGAGVNLTLDANDVGASQVTVTNSNTGLADLVVEGAAKIKGGANPLLAQVASVGQLALWAASACESLAGNQVINLTFPAFTVAPKVIASPITATAGAGFISSVTGVTTTGATVNLGGAQTGTIECVDYIAVGQI